MGNRRSRKSKVKQRANTLAKKLAPQSLTTVPGATVNAPGTIAFSRQVSSYSGPTPPPDLLRAYDEVEPGRAAKLMQLVDDQARHRMKLESTVIDSDVQRSRDGLRNATALGGVSLLGGIALVFAGHDAAGASIVATVLGGGALTFIIGKGMQMAERAAKREVIDPKRKR